MSSKTDLLQPIQHLYAAGAYADALALATPLLERRQRNNVELLNLTAACARANGDLAQAEALWRRAVTVDPRFADGHCNLGLVMKDRGRLPAAETAYRRALALQPRHLLALNNLGNLLKSLHRYQEAINAYRQVIKIDSNHVGAHSNLGNLLRDLGHDEEAEASYRAALAADPEFCEARINLGELKLSQGNFREGWPLYEARWQRPDMPRPATRAPQWKGEALTGKSLIVFPELGFGDEIQFVRYLSLLKARGTSHLTLVCRPVLKSVLETLPGIDRLLSADDPAAQSLPTPDYWTYLLSIPGHLDADPASIPASLPYLQALPERLEYWRPRLPASGFKVGLVWQGNRQHRNDHNRSLASLEILKPLWMVSDVSFVSLQNEPANAGAIPIDQPLWSPGLDLRDFADTAAVIDLLDLVISVDTAVAHLAGALGKATWLLLPARGVDWRWRAHDQDTPWYPGVIRLFRQTPKADWTSTIGFMVKELQALTANIPESEQAATG